MKIKFQVLSEFRVPVDLRRATKLVAHFKHENGDVMEKGGIIITDPDNAIGEITLSNFDEQGLQSGDGLGFLIKYVLDDIRYSALFSNAYRVVVDNEGRKKCYEN